jgi:hypothetical protein
VPGYALPDSTGFLVNDWFTHPQFGSGSLEDDFTSCVEPDLIRVGDLERNPLWIGAGPDDQIKL